jgi:hypothetical protein
VLLEKPARRGDQAGFQLGKFWGENFQPDNLRLSRMFLACVEIALFSAVPDGRRGEGIITLVIAVLSRHPAVTVRLLHPRQKL